MMSICRDVWAYVAFVPMATLCRAISYSSAGQFQNHCRAIVKRIDNNNWKKNLDAPLELLRAEMVLYSSYFDA
jgi:hypothetical protein